jgi:hypothetical protein
LEEEETTVEVEAFVVAQVVEYTVKEKSRTILAWTLQQREVCVPILSHIVFDYSQKSAADQMHLMGKAWKRY